MGLRALIWDVDGTIAETERDGHREAFNTAFRVMGLPWHWDVARYGELLRVTGGRERLLHDMRTRGDAPPLSGERDALARAVHASKNRIYGERIGSQGLPLREGVRELMDECRTRSVRMGITTTTSKTNLDALLRTHLGPAWASWFAVLVCGEDVVSKKPDPEVYLQALRRLRVGPLDAVAIEDSPGGVAAARAADVPVVVTRSVYFATATIDGAIAIGPSLGRRTGWRPDAEHEANTDRITLDDLVDWRQRMEHTSQFG